MNQYNTYNADLAALCYGVPNSAYITIGANGFSVCRHEKEEEGDCYIEGIQDLAVAHEVMEMVIGELGNAALERQHQPGIVFG